MGLCCWAQRKKMMNSRTALSSGEHSQCLLESFPVSSLCWEMDFLAFSFPWSAAPCKDMGCYVPILILALCLLAPHFLLWRERGQVLGCVSNTVHVNKRKMKTSLAPVREQSKWNGLLSQGWKMHRCWWDISSTDYILPLTPWEKPSLGAVND